MNKADIGTKDLRGNEFTRLADQTFSRLVELVDIDPKADSKRKVSRRFRR